LERAVGIVETFNLSSDHQTHRYFQVADWLFSYKKTWLRPDMIAGLTTAAVVIPKAMAYATIAGLPVQVGLYTAFVPMVIYAVLATSRPLSVSTTTTIAILTAAELGQVVPGGDSAALLEASAMLTLLVGGILVLASLLKLGFVANFISEPVLVGFKAGIGLVIVLDQIPKIIGIHFAKGSFLHNVFAIAKGIPGSSLITVAVGLAMILLLIGFEQFLPRAPAPLIAVAAGIFAVYVLGLQRSRASRPYSTRSTPYHYPGILLSHRTLARGVGHCAYEFHRDYRGRSSFCKE
jgi:MFS superfamily sulfate permease-like transporter